MGAQPTMTGREIAELVDLRHDKVKQSIERLGAKGLVDSGEEREDQVRNAIRQAAPRTMRTTLRRLPFRISSRTSPRDCHAWRRSGSSSWR